jgi:hypothetical protein
MFKSDYTYLLLQILFLVKTTKILLITFWNVQYIIVIYILYAVQ